MGEAVSAGERRLDYRVEGWDTLKSVEVVRDNIPVHLETADYGAPAAGPQAYRLRFEWGWGPMKGYQVYDWQGRLRVDGGRLSRVVPCFGSDPFDEVRRKRILEWDEGRCAWQSHTSRGSVFTTRNGSTAPRANDALCVEVEGTEETRVQLEFDCRTSKSLLATATDFTLTGQLGGSQAGFTIGELLQGRQGWRVDGLPTWIVAHRALPQALYSLEGSLHRPERDPGLLLSARHPGERPDGLEQPHLVRGLRGLVRRSGRCCRRRRQRRGSGRRRAGRRGPGPRRSRGPGSAARRRRACPDRGDGIKPGRGVPRRRSGP